MMQFPANQMETYKANGTQHKSCDATAEQMLQWNPHAVGQKSNVFL